MVWAIEMLIETQLQQQTFKVERQPNNCVAHFFPRKMTTTVQAYNCFDSAYQILFLSLRMENVGL